MSREHGKCRRPIWVNLALLALLLVTSGFMLTGCGLFKLKSLPIKQEVKNRPAAGDRNDGSADKGKVNDNDKRNTDKKYEAQGQDNEDDDDPE